MAANIQEAIDEVVQDIQPGFALAQMDTWISEMFTEAGFPAPGDFWSRESEDNRSVFDWFVPNAVARREMNVVGAGQLAVNIAINIVLKTLLAVQAAQTAGRITADQETSVVTAYTDAWE